jgi:hypothetical protein
MAFSDYTTPDSVRAVLGVSAKEAKDVLITDNVYLTHILERLDELGDTLATDYRTAAAAEPRSELQNRFVLAVQTLCAHEVALKIIPSLGALAPQRITDGQSEAQRVDNPYTQMAGPITDSLTLVRASVRRAYAKLTGANTPLSTQRTNVANSALGVDPITG